MVHVGTGEAPSTQERDLKGRSTHPSLSVSTWSRLANRGDR